jgi:hypothetical protein
MSLSVKSWAAKVLVLPAAALIAVIGISAPAFATPAWAGRVPSATCSGYGCDNQNPYGAGCFTGSYVAESAPVGPAGSTAAIYLHYSPSCRTVWASIVNAPPQTVNNAGGYADVHRNSDNHRLSCNAGYKTSCYTNMLYDGGVTSHAYGTIDTGDEIYSAYTANF